MKVNNQLLFCVLFLLIIAFSSCEKNGVYEELTGFWIVDKVVTIYNSLPPLEEQNRIDLDLNSDTEEFTINLSVNRCAGKMEVENTGYIQFFNFGCTEICCDTEWDKWLLSFLSEIRSYELNSTRLTLFVDDENYLELSKLLPE